MSKVSNLIISVFFGVLLLAIKLTSDWITATFAALSQESFHRLCVCGGSGGKTGGAGEQ